MGKAGINYKCSVLYWNLSLRGLNLPFIQEVLDLLTDSNLGIN